MVLKNQRIEGWGQDKNLRKEGVRWMVLVALLLGLPWLRLQDGSQSGELVLYPLHFLLGGLFLLQAIFLWRRNCLGIPRRAVLWAMGSLLLLLLFMLTTLLWEKQWATAAVLSTAIIANLGWGAVAFQCGMRTKNGLQFGTIAFLLLLGGLVLGGLQWMGTQLWPWACNVLPCLAGREHLPRRFMGGFVGADQYLLFLVVLLPAWGNVLFGWFRQSLVTGRFLLLLTFVLVVGVTVLLAMSLVMAVFLLLCWLILHWILKLMGESRDVQLLGGMVLLILAGGLWVYQVVPGYADHFPLVETTLRHGREAKLVVLNEEFPLKATRYGPIEVELELTNTGRLNLGTQAEAPVRIMARVLVEEPPGNNHLTETILLQPLLLSKPLLTGEQLRLPVHVTLPNWAERGHMEFLLDNGDGSVVRLAKDSKTYISFELPGGKSTLLTKENNVGTIMAQAWQPLREKEVKMMQRTNTLTLETLARDTIDTILFAPFLGIGSLSKIKPVDERGPFLLRLFRGFGLVGLILALWTPSLLLFYVWQAFRLRDSKNNGLSPLLMGISVIILSVAGLFSASVGNYHMLWALSLHLGYVQGRAVASIPNRGAINYSEMLLPRPWQQVSVRVIKGLYSYVPFLRKRFHVRLWKLLTGRQHNKNKK